MLVWTFELVRSRQMRKDHGKEQTFGTVCTEGEQSGCGSASKWADVGSGMWPYWEEVQCGHVRSWSLH